MNIFKSRATEPKKSTWTIMAKRFHQSGFTNQEDWMNDCLERAGYNPEEWMKTGEMPSEMICRFASKSKKHTDIDAFLLDIMKNSMRLTMSPRNICAKCLGLPFGIEPFSKKGILIGGVVMFAVMLPLLWWAK